MQVSYFIPRIIVVGIVWALSMRYASSVEYSNVKICLKACLAFKGKTKTRTRVVRLIVPIMVMAWAIEYAVKFRTEELWPMLLMIEMGIVLVGASFVVYYNDRVERLQKSARCRAQKILNAIKARREQEQKVREFNRKYNHELDWTWNN